MSFSAIFSRFILATLVVAMLGCSRPAEPLRVASHVWPGYELMFLARDQGWLPNEGLAFVETGSATESLELLTSGAADAAALTLDEVLRARAAGSLLTVVLVFDESAGADVLLARPELESLQDLRGRRLGVERTALGALMLNEILARAGLSEEDLELIPLEIDEQAGAWNAGRLDAVITYPPVASRLEQQGARRLFDSREIPGTIIDVLAVKPEAVRRHGEALRALIAGHFRALHYLRSNPHDAEFRMARRLGVQGQDVAGLFRGLNLPDQVVNHGYLEESRGVVVEAARRLSRVMVAADLLPENDTMEGMVDGRYLPRSD